MLPRSRLAPDRTEASEVVLTGTQAVEKPGKHWVDKPNAGYSGTPMWKLELEKKNQDVVASGPTVVKIPEGFKVVTKGSEWFYNDKKQVFWRSTDGQMYVWDAVGQKHARLHEGTAYETQTSVGSCFHDTGSKLRHVLVRDVHKAGQALRMSLEHLDRPCALYALYEGHRTNAAATSSGNACAEFCVKGLHQKLLPRLAAFRGQWEDSRLVAAMTETFEELDKEWCEKHSSGAPSDGCCAAVALMTGNRLVVASLGDVACVLVNQAGEASELLKAHAAKDSDDEDSDDEDDDEREPRAMANAAAGGEKPPVRWTRAFGDVEFKAPTSSHRILSTPEVKVIEVDKSHRGFAFICRALYNAIGRSVAVSTVFKRSAGRPRMASGSLVDAAVQWLGGQVGGPGLGSIVAFFDRVEEAKDVLLRWQKKARIEAPPPSQVRLRHILLKHKECKNPVDKVRSKQVKRQRGEAERLLRGVLEELSGDPKMFTQRCRDMSECQSCLKAGELSGDLGWTKPNSGKWNPTFESVAFALQVGQLSDLVDSDQGVHVILRTA